MDSLGAYTVSSNVSLLELPMIKNLYPLWTDFNVFAWLSRSCAAADLYSFVARRLQGSGQVLHRVRGPVSSPGVSLGMTLDSLVSVNTLCEGKNEWGHRTFLVVKASTVDRR